MAREFEALLEIEKVIREDKNDLLNFTEVSYQDLYGREQKKSKEGKENFPDLITKKKVRSTDKAAAKLNHLAKARAKSL